MCFGAASTVLCTWYFLYKVPTTFRPASAGAQRFPGESWTPEGLLPSGEPASAQIRPTALARANPFPSLPPFQARNCLSEWRLLTALRPPQSGVPYSSLTNVLPVRALVRVPSVWTDQRKQRSPPLCCQRADLCRCPRSHSCADGRVTGLARNRRSSPQLCSTPSSVSCWSRIGAQGAFAIGSAFSREKSGPWFIFLRRCPLDSGLYLLSLPQVVPLRCLPTLDSSFRESFQLSS